MPINQYRHSIHSDQNLLEYIDRYIQEDFGRFNNRTIELKKESELKKEFSNETLSSYFDI